MTELRSFQREFIKRALAPGVDVAALSIPRGNGKSWLAAHLLQRCVTPGDALYKPGSEYLLCAGSIEQARLCMLPGFPVFLGQPFRGGFAHSPRVGMAQDLSAAGGGGGAAGADDRRKMGESHDASQVHRGPDRRQGRRRSLLPGRPPGIRLMGAAAVGGMTTRLLGGPIKVR